MTIDEARKIAAIATTADGGCTVCVGDLFERLNEAFPEFSFETQDSPSEGWAQLQEEYECFPAYRVQVR